MVGVEVSKDACSRAARRRAFAAEPAAKAICVILRNASANAAQLTVKAVCIERTSGADPVVARLTISTGNITRPAVVDLSAGIDALTAATDLTVNSAIGAARSAVGIAREEVGADRGAACLIHLAGNIACATVGAVILRVDA